jgi:outer membrane protein assembly factor BamD (BamD/ComL family)
MTKILKITFTLILIFASIIIFGISFYGCAASRMTQYTFDKQLLSDAEDKFNKKNYKEALAIYQILINSPEFSKTYSAKLALYKIGLINIYYDNPDADINSAISAFNLYKTRYPTDPRIGEINSIIKILVALKSFEAQYDETSMKLKKLQTKTALTNVSLDTLLEKINKCSFERDSLSLERSILLKKINDLEQTIIKMEKTK